MENRFTAVSLAIVIAIASPSPLRADVIDASATGFTVRTTAGIAAPPPKGDGLARLAPLVDPVLGEQVKRLKAFVETGKP